MTGSKAHSCITLKPHKSVYLRGDCGCLAHSDTSWKNRGTVAARDSPQISLLRHRGRALPLTKDVSSILFNQQLDWTNNTCYSCVHMFVESPIWRLSKAKQQLWESQSALETLCQEMGAPFESISVPQGTVYSNVWPMGLNIESQGKCVSVWVSFCPL